MKGTTTISAEYSDGSNRRHGFKMEKKSWKQLVLIIAGSIMTGLKPVALISLLMVWGATRGRKQDGSQKIEYRYFRGDHQQGRVFQNQQSSPVATMLG